MSINPVMMLGPVVSAYGSSNSIMEMKLALEGNPFKTLSNKAGPLPLWRCLSVMVCIVSDLFHSYIFICSRARGPHQPLCLPVSTAAACRAGPYCVAVQSLSQGTAVQHASMVSLPGYFSPKHGSCAIRTSTGFRKPLPCSGAWQDSHMSSTKDGLFQTAAPSEQRCLGTTALLMQ